MKATHQKRPYLAECVRWDGTNFDELGSIFSDIENVGSSGWLMVRGKQVFGIPLGYWVVTGENGQVKVYSDAIFNIKYETTSTSTL